MVLHNELTGTGIQNVVMLAAFQALELRAALKSAALSAKLAEVVS
jgi:hypothetical protein